MKKQRGKKSKVLTPEEEASILEKRMEALKGLWDKVWRFTRGAFHPTPSPFLPPAPDIFSCRHHSFFSEGGDG